MAEHNHVGDPSYFAYVHHGCRHDDCFAEMTAYRQRLQDRHATQVPPVIRVPKSYVQEVEEVSEPENAQPDVQPSQLHPEVAQGVPALPAPESSVAEAPQQLDPAAAKMIQATAQKVFSVLQIARDPFTGAVKEGLLAVLPASTGLSGDQVNQFIEALVGTGVLERRNGKMYLPSNPGDSALNPKTPDFSAAIDQLLSRISGAVGNGQ